jgi:hypothetical protein
MNYTYTIHYQLCDDVLNNIQKDDDMHEVNIEEFLSERRTVKLAIVRKLDEDGYIHRVHPQTDPFRISITVEGRQFWVDGGYKAKFNDLREKEHLENRLLKTNIKTNVFSAVVGLSVIISAYCQYKTLDLETTKEKEKLQIEIATKNLLDRVKILEFKAPHKEKIADSIKK